MNSKKALLVFNFLFIIIIQGLSQASFSGLDLGSDFNRAMDLYNKEKYAAAIRLFDSYIKDNKDNNSINRSEAEYYAALSALRLFNPDSEYRMIVYMATHPESPKINEARISLADYFYQNKSYRKACSYYDIVDRYQLEKEKLPEYFFR